MPLLKKMLDLVFSLLYGAPTLRAESQHQEAWSASTYGHLRGYLQRTPYLQVHCEKGESEDGFKHLVWSYRKMFYELFLTCLTRKCQNFTDKLFNFKNFLRNTVKHIAKCLQNPKIRFKDKEYYVLRMVLLYVNNVFFIHPNSIVFFNTKAKE